MISFRLRVLAAASVVLVASACGSGSSAGTPSTGRTGTAGSSASTGAGALVAEARQTAAGDIPDNQVFLTYRDRAVPYSMKYPEGWAVSAQGATTTIRDKNNLIRIVASSGSRPTVATVTSELARLKARTPSLRPGGAPSASPTCAIRGQTRALPAASVRVDYSTLSAADPVTGKRVKLLVNRYYLFHAGHVVTVDEGTPQGVDNVDAYCLMISSFRWQ
jgi:hypothetical protein